MFRGLGDGHEWVALAQVGDVYVMVEATGLPVGSFALVRISDPDPYLRNLGEAE